ncbi:MAG: hypothetical protein IRZ06_12415 [Nevskia sp.]|nr:hypothetical protein [Nevskia sp.]
MLVSITSTPGSGWIAAVVAFLLIATPAWAAGEANGSACRDIADDAQRLACYDREFGDAKPPAAVAPAAPAIPSPVAPGPAAQTPVRPAIGNPERDFGAEALPPPPVDKAKDTLEAHVLGRIEGLAKGMDLVLDNGQVWRCVDDQPYADYAAENPAVRIKRNFLGNYWMGFVGSGVHIRVRRVK